MACGIVGKQASTKCKVQGGDSVAFEWRVDRNIPAAEYPLKGDEPVGVIDDSHMGPCAVYAKKVDNALTAVGAGDGWFKVCPRPPPRLNPISNPPPPRSQKTASTATASFAALVCANPTPPNPPKSPPQSSPATTSCAPKS